MSHLLNLPPEMLEEIFKKLDLESKLQLGRSCHALAQFVSNPIHWMNLRLTYNGNFTNFRNVKLILFHFRTLSITCRRQTNIDILIPEIFWYRSLLRLSLTNVYTTFGSYEDFILLPLAELHIYSNDMDKSKIEYPLMNISNSTLKVMTIHREKFKFRNWVTFHQI